MTVEEIMNTIMAEKHEKSTHKLKKLSAQALSYGHPIADMDGVIPYYGIKEFALFIDPISRTVACELSAVISVTK